MHVHNSIYSVLNKQRIIELFVIGIAYSERAVRFHIQITQFMWKEAIATPISKLPFSNSCDYSVWGENLTTLTVESLHGFCHKVLIPKLFLQWQADVQHSECSIRDRDPQLLTKEMFLSKNRISTLSIPTCWRWLRRLGFTCNTQRKEERVLC